MTGFTRHQIPAEITVFAGDFASQPLAFAHLLDAAPMMDLDHVEVIQTTDPTARLAVYFSPTTAAAITAAKGARDTLILVLPAAFEGLECPLPPTAHLAPLGRFRGTITRLSPRATG